MSLQSLYRDGRYYDLEFEGWSHDIPFYTSLVEARPGAVLDLGCGTGRITIPLAKLNVPVVGLDLMPSMLEQAKRNGMQAGVQVEWIQGDMTSYNLGKQFEWVFLPFNSMQHLHKWEDLRATLSNIKRHLHSDGAFAFDVVNPFFPDLTSDFSLPKKVKEFDDPDGKGRVKIYARFAYDKKARIARTKLSYSIGQNENVREEEIVLNCFDPDELVQFLTQNGFKVAEKYGSYAKAPFTQAAKELVIVCKMVG
jgi:2-polyprenyl-3-methyl-5-hydroxy-6-metoxy-1,4-benzoquinol methylase